MPSERYDLPGVAVALLVLIDHQGNAEAAARQLGIPARTLRHWRSHTHRLAYEHLRETRELQQELRHGEELEDTYRSRLERGIRPSHYTIKLAKLTETQLERTQRLAELDAVTTAQNTA